MKARRKSAGMLLLVGLALFLLPFSSAWGQQQVQKARPKPQKTGEKQAAKETPIHITASRLDADQQTGVILFTGQVKAVQGDSTLYCDQLWVYYKTSPSPKKTETAAPGPPRESPDQAKPPEAKPASPLGDMGGEKIDRIVAKGQVRFVQEDRVATGQEATYYKDKEEVVLVGNPQMWRGENTLKGEKIIFNLATNKVLVESSQAKRVEAHLYSSQAAGGEKAVLPFGAPKGQKAPPKGGKARSQL